jgi:hypothetical protein
MAFGVLRATFLPVNLPALATDGWRSSVVLGEFKTFKPFNPDAPFKTFKVEIVEKNSASKPGAAMGSKQMA